jgi:predicted ribosome quality control (RQC) complex YloA/Tae2 family protein
MNNYYALLHLTKHLGKKIGQSRFLFSYSPHRDVCESYLAITENNIVRLVFSSNSTETSLFLDKYRPRKKSNVTTFFSDAENEIITSVTLADNDRYISLMLSSGKKLLFRLFGNNPNIFLTDEGIIKESFKSGSEYENQPEPVPRAAGAKKKIPDDSLPARRKITVLYPKFPRHLLDDVVNHYGLEDKSADEIAECTGKLVDAMIHSPEFRVTADGNLCLVPDKLLPVPVERKFDDVNEAVKYVYYNTSRQRRLSAKKKAVGPKIDQALRKAESAVNQLQQADVGLDRAGRYEQLGHILMAHAHDKLPPESDSVTLPDFYNNDEPVQIEIKPGMSMAGNAQRYYDKAAKAVRNVEESEKRLKQTLVQLRELKELKKSFDQVEKVFEFDGWYSDNKPKMEKLGLLRTGGAVETLPYRTTEIDGYEIWIGRNARSNDRLTSDAHKEDIWLHARGVSGSHVVIRMNNSKDMPPQHIISRAAALAAWNSKARGSSLVPVIVTKRKYVNKPKGALPGAVTIQREQVEMVRPQKTVS